MKMSKINNTEDFLAKLDSIEFHTSDNEKTLIGDFKGHEVKVQYSLKVSSIRGDSTPIQVVVYVTIDDVHAQSWGCCDNEDNAITLRWFMKKQSAISNKKYADRGIKEGIAKNIMDLM
tara:strand:- start:52 stop:405 length:354 start_codon:yes stop_codon:yes gene_type:complete